MPISYIEKVRDPNNEWGKIGKKSLNKLSEYENKWGLIKEFMKNPNKVNK